MDWKRIVNIVKKTGERCIVVDPDHDDPVVVMSLSDYEFLTEGRELLEEFDFGFDEQLPEGVPFEPELESIVQEWGSESEEETPVFERTEENPPSAEEPAVIEESWYIEPISEDGQIG